jgi:putative phosphoribosyl transferase
MLANPPYAPPVTERRGVPTADALLAGELTIPADACAVVLLAGARREVADRLLAAGVAVLSLELLTAEERTGAPPDAGRLARRLVAAIDWLDLQRELRGLPVACRGEGTAAAAVLIASGARERVSPLTADWLSRRATVPAGPSAA